MKRPDVPGALILGWIVQRLAAYRAVHWFWTSSVFLLRHQTVTVMVKHPAKSQ
jgi:hypothetical protein